MQKWIYFYNFAGQNIKLQSIVMKMLLLQLNNKLINSK